MKSASSITDTYADSFLLPDPLAPPAFIVVARLDAAAVLGPGPANALTPGTAYSNPPIASIGTATAGNPPLSAFAACHTLTAHRYPSGVRWNLGGFPRRVTRSFPSKVFIEFHPVWKPPFSLVNMLTRQWSLAADIKSDLASWHLTRCCVMWSSRTSSASGSDVFNGGRGCWR